MIAYRKCKCDLTPNTQGRVEGLKGAATSRSLGNRGYGGDVFDRTFPSKQ